MRCCAGLTLTCRAGWLAPPSRPRCSCGRDGGIAAVCQRLRSSGHSRCGLPDSLWSRGHSLLEPGTVDTAFGACPVAPALSSIFKGSLNLGRMGICGEPVTFGPCVKALHGLSHAAMHGLCGRQRLHSQTYLQMPAAGDLLWIYTASWHLSGAYAVTCFSTVPCLYCNRR